MDNFYVNHFFSLYFVSHWQNSKVHILDTEGFETTFGPKAQRKRPSLTVGDMKDLIDQAEASVQNYSEDKDKDLITEDTGVRWNFDNPQYTIVIPDCLSQNVGCLLAEIASLNSECSQQGRGSWGNFQKGSVQENLGGTLQGIVAINLINSGLDQSVVRSFCNHSATVFLPIGNWFIWCHHPSAGCPWPNGNTL